MVADEIGLGYSLPSMIGSIIWLWPVASANCQSLRDRLTVLQAIGSNRLISV